MKKIRLLEEVQTDKGIVPKDTVLERDAEFRYKYLDGEVVILDFSQSVLDAMEAGMLTGFRWEYC